MARSAGWGTERDLTTLGARTCPRRCVKRRGRHPTPLASQNDPPLSGEGASGEHNTGYALNMRKISVYMDGFEDPSAEYHLEIGVASRLEFSDASEFAIALGLRAPLPEFEKFDAKVYDIAANLKRFAEADTPDPNNWRACYVDDSDETNLGDALLFFALIEADDQFISYRLSTSA